MFSGFEALMNFGRNIQKVLSANVSKGDVPKSDRGLARYLAGYIASPPIAIRRIVEYTGKTVSYWRQDHKTKSGKFEKVDVFTFIGRMAMSLT